MSTEEKRQLFPQIAEYLKEVKEEKELNKVADSIMDIMPQTNSNNYDTIINDLSTYGGKEAVKRISIRQTNNEKKLFEDLANIEIDSYKKYDSVNNFIEVIILWFFTPGHICRDKACLQEYLRTGKLTLIKNLDSDTVNDITEKNKKIYEFTQEYPDIKIFKKLTVDEALELNYFRIDPQTLGSAVKTILTKGGPLDILRFCEKLQIVDEDKMNGRIYDYLYNVTLLKHVVPIITNRETFQRILVEGEIENIIFYEDSKQLRKKKRKN